MSVVVRQIALVVALLFLFGEILAQVGGAPERAAMKSLRKKHWEKAETQLRKSIRKDSVNVPSRYLLSACFFSRDNPAYNLDSAYGYVMGALRELPLTSLKERERMKRMPLDSNVLVNLRISIDSAAFEAVRLVNTEEAYIRYLQEHPFTLQRQAAMDQRDEVAYLHAATVNTYEAFLEFLKKYPQAAKAPMARTKYDRLLYETLTKDKRLVSFENFLRNYPETPFRREIEQNIFELFTLSGEVERYISFLQLYPTSAQVKRANDILFHLLQEKDDPQPPGLYLSDSLQNIICLQENYIVPFFRNDRFGFMDREGREIIPPTLEALGDDYKCGNITEDILVLPGRVLARDGHVVYAGEVEEVDDLGAGFLKLTSGNCRVVVHKSGRVITPCTADARILGNRFLSLQRNDQWYVYSLTGRPILQQGWDAVMMDHNVLALKKKNKWHLLTSQQVVALADEQKTVTSDAYDEIKFLPGGLVSASAGDSRMILNQTLGEIISRNRQEIVPTFFGFMGRSYEGYSIYDRAGKQASAFEQVKLSEPWTAVKKDGTWHLFDTSLQQYRSPAYDSIRFEGPFAVGVKADTLSVYFNEHTMIGFPRPAKTFFVPGKDSTSFLYVETGEAQASGKASRNRKATEVVKSLYNRQGKKLFTASFDQIQHAGRDLFIVHKKEKKGLTDAEGETVLPVEYDAIGSVTDNVVSLLKAMKFGLYHAERQKLIKPQSDKNLIPFMDLVAVYRDGQYHLVDWNGKPADKTTFEEIRFWNDTAALIKVNQVWSLYDIRTKEVSMPGIRNIQMIRDSPDEKVAIIQRNNAYGVLSNKRGTVIPITFSDLVNIGSAEEPLYFTEKHVTEASIFVVIYYDKNGKLLRREVYDNADDYEKIYCPDN